MKNIIYFGDNVRIKEGILKDGSIELETLEVMMPGTTLLILEGYGRNENNGRFFCRIRSIF